MEKPVIIVVGTRPDAIKLIPVYQELLRRRVSTLLCATNQHRELLDQVFTLFKITPDIELNIMKENQHLGYLTATVVQKCFDLFLSAKPQLVIVQGDTTSSFGAALAAYYLNIPVAHVEAGLRTGNIRSPFPEEMNRIFITRLSTLHFAPTPLNVLNLLNEGVPANSVFCVGNTVVDALSSIQQLLKDQQIVVDQGIVTLVDIAKKSHKKLILFTTHRRESFETGIAHILNAISECAQRFQDLFICFPVHPNPKVQALVAQSSISTMANVHCCPPLGYGDLIYLLQSCQFVVTDSGGLQEEALSLGKKVLVLREHTERVEALWTGASKLVGTDTNTIIATIQEWLTHPDTTNQQFIYGDGTAAQRIVQKIIDLHQIIATVEQSISASIPLFKNYNDIQPLHMGDMKEGAGS